MAIELNRVTFRRLIQLYVVTLLLSSGPVVWRLFDPFWTSFDKRFDLLARSQFARPEFPDWVIWFAGVGFSIAAAWSIASLIGIFWFSRWARLGFWASAVPLLIFATVLFGFRPYFTTVVDDLFGIIEGALFGAIVLLAYAEGFGAEWFAPPEKNQVG